MNTYFSTFASGLGEVVEEALKEAFKDAEVKLRLDGLVVYSTNASVDEINTTRFFNNSFLLIKLFENLGFRPIEEMLEEVLGNPDLIKEGLIGFPRKKASFRIIISRENQPSSVDRKRLEKVEEAIAQTSGLSLNRAGSDFEFWFLWRSEGKGFFGLRLTKKPSTEKYLAKGELRPELANLLIRLSEPKADETFLDPFAGHGAIPMERLIAFPPAEIIAVDSDLKMIELIKTKAGGKMKITLGDALDLNFLSDNSVDKVVTDPPWGFYCSKGWDLSSFYTAMLKEFGRVIKTNGLMVVLVAKKDIFESLLEQFFNQLGLIKKFDILVSGKKAGVYKIRKLS